MKKIIGLMLITIVASMSAMIYAGTPVDRSELPEAALKFLNKHFPGDDIRRVEMDSEWRHVEYDVDLQSGAEVEFRENGDWKDVKAAHGQAIPAAIIPVAISKYVAANYKDLVIIEISRKRGGYEVELSNGIELRLTEDAKPMSARQGGGHRGNRR